MKYKVRIKQLPKARMGYQVNGALKNDSYSMSGTDYKRSGNNNSIRPQKSIGKVPRNEANLEAEGGETVLGDINFDGFPEHYTIKGPRHAQGGVPLKLPEDTFIFSDFREMKINDPDLLEKFGKIVKKAEKQKSYTPAQLAKQYDINHYRTILQDPDSDELDIKTAELMIRNYNMKLGALALAQEAKKGFPQGIPMIAQPFMEANGLSEEDFIPQEEEAVQAEMPQQPMGSGQEMPTQMPDGQPIAQPQEMEQMMPPNMGQEPMAMYGMEMYNPMMMHGGYPHRRLRRAQDGMQQPSEEEMMMMQQAQQQPQEQGGGDQMEQIMQAVSQALEQGGQPEEIIPELLENRISPEEIMQIFVELGMPEQEIGSILQSVMQQMQGGQQQMDPRQMQQPTSEEEMMMMQQQDPSQMQESPMAQYGMSMGGFYPEYAFGGNVMHNVKIKQLPKAENGDAGKKKKLPNRSALDKERLAKEKNRKYNPKKEGEGWIDLGNGEWGRGSRGGIDVSTKKRSKGSGSGGGYTKEDVCAWMKSENSNWYGATAQQMIDLGIVDPSNLGYLKGCEVVDEEMEYYKEESDKECVCTVDGKEVITPLDKDGNCPCEEEVKKCYCLDENGEKIEVPCGPNGTEPDCPGGTKGIAQGKSPAKYWIQDTRNSVNAFMDRMNLKKYLPWSARVDLEEGRPYWLDPTRQYAALGERAATEMAGNAAFAGAQQQGARNAASQAATLQGIADIGDNINKQNVMLANQWDQTKTGIRNQENLLRGDAETKDFTGTTIANQQFDNADMALYDNQTLAANTADTNKYKTDGMNQMYPNYKVDPSVGGQMYYNPTLKKPNPIKPEDEIAYANALKGSGLDPEVQKVMMNNWYKSQGTDNSAAPDPNMIAAMYSQKGGVMFKNGGFIYMAWPEIM